MLIAEWRKKTCFIRFSLENRAFRGAFLAQQVSADYGVITEVQILH